MQHRDEIIINKVIEEINIGCEMLEILSFSSCSV